MPLGNKVDPQQGGKARLHVVDALLIDLPSAAVH